MNKDIFFVSYIVVWAAALFINIFLKLAQPFQIDLVFIIILATVALFKDRLFKAG